jgi:hypothetical protein
MKPNDRADVAVVEMMQGHVTVIRDGVDGVRSCELVPNEVPGNKGFNWAVLSGFDNEEDMARNKAHPLHRDFIVATGPYEEDLIVIGYRRD